MSPHRWLAPLAIGALFAWPVQSLARRQRPDERAARRAPREGVEQFDAGRYVRAARSFQRALQILREPGLLWHLARALEEQGELKSAVFYFEELLAEFPGAEGAEDAAARLEDIRPRLAGSLFVDCGSVRDPPLLLEGEPRPCSRLIADVAPGVYAIEATAPGKATWTFNVRIPPSSRQRIRVPWRKAEDVPPHPLDEEDEEEPPLAVEAAGVPWAAVSAAAAGALLLGVGATYTLRGVWARRRFEEMEDRSRIRASTIEGEVGRANEAFLAADVLYVSGAVGLAAGGVLWAFHGGSGPAPVVSPGGLSLTWKGAW